MLPSSDTHERPAISARRPRTFVPAYGWISSTKGVPPFHAASLYGTGTTVVVDWIMTVDRVPLV